MRTKTPKQSAPKSDVANSGEVLKPTVISSADSGKDKPDRISFNLSSDGKPDFDRMSPRTKEQLKKALLDKSVQIEFGISPERAKIEEEELKIDQDETTVILDMLQGIDAVAASRIYNVSMEIAGPAFTFDEFQRKKISPKLAKVLNKWAPLAALKWKDEIGLGIVLVSTINAQINMMHFLERKRIAALPPASRPRPISSPPEPVAPPASPPADKKEEVAEVDAISDTLGFNA